MPAPKFEFTAELAEEICDWIADGNTLRAFCRQPGKPSFKTVYRWMEANKEFQTAMELARQVGFDAIADEALQIADTPEYGTVKTVEGGGDGGEGGKDSDCKVTVRNEDMLGHRKLRVETRLKLLAKWHPKKYGERTTLAGDPDAPLGTGVMVVPAPVSEDAWAVGLAAQQRQLTEREDAASRQGGSST